jgi:5-methylcytosine-specific restriction enzyme B
MTVTTNETFGRLLEVIKGMGEAASERVSDSEDYKAFIAKYPLDRLDTLSADEYCVGKGEKTSFCWWLERGLEQELGRYMPGTSRGHIIYFKKEDGALYKNKLLEGLSDNDALAYTLKVQKAIASADPAQDIRWIDDDIEVYKRAGVTPRVTVGDGRKLRLLAAYHPEDVLPFSSSRHVGHFLEKLGCEPEKIPEKAKPVARMLLLREYYQLAKQSIPALSTRGFVKALYSPEMGIAPVKPAEPDDLDEDDDGPSPAYLLTWNPEHLKLGGDGGVVVGEEQRWTCHSKQPQVGDAVYLIRLGQEPRGIVARGAVTQGSFEEPHWKDANKPARYIRFRVDEFRPDAASGLLPMVLLTQAAPGQKWSPQSSGIGIPATAEPTLRQLWEAGAGKHSLRQYVDWVGQDPKARREEWLIPYRQVTALARSLREDVSLIDSAAVDLLWRAQNNGVAGVGAGGLSGDEFEKNIALLTELTKQILQKPDAETLASVENRWQQAVADKSMSRMNRTVVKRVFAAVAPESATSLLKESDCQKLLGLLKRQFELSSDASNKEDWLALNANIVACMREGGLDPQRLIENNIAMWGLVEQLSQPAPAKPALATAEEPTADYVTPELSGLSAPTNLILYGPPGTGKTFQTIEEAIKVIAPDLLEGEPNRAVLKSAFDGFVASGQIVFTTFHQSFSYEDFVEGIRADASDDGQLRYSVVDGVFRRICAACNGTGGARRKAAFASPFHVGEMFGGYEVKKCTADIVELLKPRGNYLPIGMSLLEGLAALVRSGRITIEDIRQRQTFEKVADTTLEPYLVNGYANLIPLLVDRLVSLPANESEADPLAAPRGPRVLIIDEINRGNISRIFGELITLIEPSKRAGMPEALSVTLPYSGDQFSVPANLHIVGTMNTADRSLAGLDIALRRRFEFHEMLPRPELLDDLYVEEVCVGKLLRVINERIELLLDRDHCIGHAYFMPLLETPRLELLGHIFQTNVLPLLQEYFFEDWQRIQWVLNDHRKLEPLQFVRKPRVDLDRLFGSGVGVNDQSLRWEVCKAAFLLPAAYAGVIGVAETGQL